MRLVPQYSLSALLLAGFCVNSSQAFSLNELRNHKKVGFSLGSDETLMLTQKEITRMTTQRETIKMPSATPMVPWKVSKHKLCLYGGG
jgi:hypothetical protein